MLQAKTTIHHRNRHYTISYFVRAGGPKTIFYLHGLGNTKKDFLGALEVEALKKYTLIGLDFPGCGDSQPYHREIPLGIEDLATITLKLALYLNLKKIIIIGQSLGGLTGQVFAMNYPDHLYSLISVEGNLTPQDCNVQSRDVFRYRFLGDEEAFFARIEKRMRESKKPGFEDFIATMRKNIVDRAYFDYSRSLVDYSDGVPLLEKYINLPMPTLYIHGSNNADLPQIPVLQKAGKAVASIADSDHFPTMTNPVDFYRAVAGFLQA
jgi:pimeloyl-ACP methyl ester carboxylesterase